MPTPYRKSDAKTLQRSAPPATFEYIAKRKDANDNVTHVLIRAVSLPLLATTVSACHFGGEVGGGVLLISLVAAVLWYRLRQDGGRALFTIQGTDLVVALTGDKRKMLSVALGDLDDVVLDSKTIQRVHEGNALTPATRLLDPRVGLAVDTSRIALKIAGKPLWPLTEHYLAHMDAIESIAKLRVFLRSHGWQPVGSE
jgi:hypothetical protein